MPWLPELFGRAFAPIPDVPVHLWAESGAFTLRKAPEPSYRSSRTPWTRRAQDLPRHPWHDGRRVRRLGVKKCSRSGFTEGAILNVTRWMARYRPAPVIISLDSQKEADNIRERLLPTLLDLGQQLFTGEKDDLAKWKLRLREMDVTFTGSFTGGAFSNKDAVFIGNDEIDLYGEVGGEGDTVENFYSRCKGQRYGFQTVLSKPAHKEGPIDSFFERGNQELWHVRCPHHGCRDSQALEFDRLAYNHCKDLGGAWDYDRLLRETFYRCRKCGQPIYDHHKKGMNAEGLWIPTAKGDPEIITQHISDLYSMFEDTTFGHIAKAWVNACEKDDRRLKQTVYQQHLGLGWETKIQKIETPDILKLRRPYRRGAIPHGKCALLLGVDIGKFTNTRWVVYAFNRAGEMWLIDWGVGTGPADVITLMRTKSYPCIETGANQPIQFAFIDARYRQDEVYETCLLAPRQIFPIIGLKGSAARSIDYRQVPGKPEGFGLLTFINRDAMFDLYIDRIKNQAPPGLHWPENVEDTIIREHCAERLIRHKRNNRVIWEDDHHRPNHGGDASKIALSGIDWLIGGKRSRILSDINTAAETDIAPSVFGEAA